MSQKRRLEEAPSSSAKRLKMIEDAEIIKRHVDGADFVLGHLAEHLPDNQELRVYRERWKAAIGHMRCGIYDEAMFNADEPFRLEVQDTLIQCA